MSEKRIFVCLALLCVLCSTSALEDLVETKFGAIRGLLSEESRQFLGIPFAAPPQRWQPPEDPHAWSGVLNATSFAEACLQTVCTMPTFVCPIKVSEDCLYLNVFTPRREPDNQKGPSPVAVWIHGGSFEYGTAASEVYNSSRFANQTGVIVVTFNYRLGALGFLKTSTMQGNFGILDQLKALQWVRDNIANFGGDPEKVTIFGESAGGLSVAALLVSPMAKGLFHRAILESAPLSIFLRNSSDAINFGNKFVQKAGCAVDDLSCLLALSSDQIIATQSSMYSDSLPSFSSFLPWIPTAQTPEIPVQPFDSLSVGEMESKVPILLGTMSQEGVMFIYSADQSPVPLWQYDAVLLAFFGLHSFPKVANEYPIPSNMTADTRSIISQLATDYIFVCPARRISAGLAHYSKLPVYQFSFDHVLSFPGAWGDDFKFCWDAVCHGAELPILFGNARLYFDPTPEEETLAVQMMMYWASFMRDGVPNNWSSPNDNQDFPPQVQWPAFTTTVDPSLVFATPQNFVESAIRGQQCDFWDAMGYHFSGLA